MTYAATAWAANISDTSLKTLKTIQSIILKTITGAEAYVRNLAIRNSTNIPTIKDIIKRNVRNVAENNI